MVMRRWLVLLVTLVALLGAARPASAELSIVTTTTDLAALAKAVGGDHVKVTPLALHTQDPHWVDARPHLALELAKADALVLIGMELEVGWLPTLLTGSRNGEIQPGSPGYIDASQFVSPLEVPTGKVDRSMGDIHAQGNPHYLYDPRRAAKVASGIADRFAKLDPAHAEQFRGNAKQFGERLAQWQKHWTAKLAGLRGKKVIGYHRSLAYLADWLGFSVPINVEPRPGIPPNPRHVAQVIELAQQSQVSMILQETWFPKTTSKLIAEKSGAKLVVIPGATNYAGGESYFGFLNEVVKRLRAGVER